MKHGRFSCYRYEGFCRTFKNKMFCGGKGGKLNLEYFGKLVQVSLPGQEGDAEQKLCQDAAHSPDVNTSEIMVKKLGGNK
jgi:hypothetical protein